MDQGVEENGQIKDAIVNDLDAAGIDLEERTCGGEIGTETVLVFGEDVAFFVYSFILEAIIFFKASVVDRNVSAFFLWYHNDNLFFPCSCEVLEAGVENVGGDFNEVVG